MKPCPKCGFHNPDDAVCCINCGYGNLNEDDPLDILDPSDHDGVQHGRSKGRSIFWTVVGLLVLLILFFRITSDYRISRLEQNITLLRTEIAEQSDVTANPGGAAPTAVPSVTPTFLSGMQSPDFCKLEMALVHDYAEKVGAAGLLTPERYEQSRRTCVFLIRDVGSVNDAGHIYVIHEDDAGYGITLEYLSGDPRISAWGKTLLMSLDKDMAESDAEAVIAEAMESGKSAVGGYALSFTDPALSGMAELKISNRTQN